MSIKPSLPIVRPMLFGLLCCVVLSAQGFAQGPEGGRGRFGGPRGGGPGGFLGGRGGFGGGRGLLGELFNESVRDELQISEDQQQQITNLLEEQRNNRGDLGDIFQRMRAAQTDEERELIRTEIAERMEEARKATDAKIQQILNPEQMTRLQQLTLQREGPGALLRNEELAAELGLTDEQKEKLATLSEERSQARSQLPRGDDEARTQFDQEWTAKYLSVLTPEQQTKWQEKLGPPPSSTSERQETSRPRPASEVTPRRMMTEEAPNGATPISSFQAAPPANADVSGSTSEAGDAGTRSTGEEPAHSGEKKLSFNFRYAPWSDVLKLFADEAGLSLDLNALPPGTFNYYDQAQYTPTEALDILNGYLLPKGFCLLRRDDFLVCVNIDEPIPPNLIPNVSANDLESRGRNELLTVIFPLAGVDVEQVAAEIDQIKGPQGKVAGLKSTNSLLVTDIGSNLIRIRDLLQDVTARGGPDDITFKAYQVRHVPVSDVQLIVQHLLGIAPTVTNVSASNESRGRGGFNFRDMMRGGPPPASKPEPDPPKVRVTTDPRTNQLLVTGTLAQHALVENALRTVDVAGEASVFSPTSNRPFLKVYTVNSSDPREVTKTIDALMPGVVVNEDGRNGKIHIQATPDQHRQVETLIAQLDGQASNLQMAVIPLRSLDPVSVSSTIRSMFARDGTQAPVLEPDLYGRQIMVRASPAQLAQIRTLLTQLGEDGTLESGTSSPSRLRTVPLGGRDPDELLPLIQRMWEASHSAQLRVVEPRNASPTGSLPTARPSQSTPTETLPAERTSPESARSPRQMPVQSEPNSVRVTPKPQKAIRVIPATQTTPVEQDSPQDQPNDDLNDLLDEFLGTAEPQTRMDETPQPPAAGSDEHPSSATQQPAGADVSVKVIGDDLLITSPDPAQLDEFQALLERALQALPPRLTWTVFPLHAADATETARMLKSFFPDSRVIINAPNGTAQTLQESLTTDTGGLGTIGASPVLQIVPDPRLNSLFVTGPATRVREVEEMLKVLDASSLGTPSLRDKMARVIPVEYADANEVYGIVKEVYKDAIDPPRAIRNNMGPGGRGGGEPNEQIQISSAQMAVGVDTNTSQLIVWSDEPLYREVASLVESLDLAAQEARRTVRVVTLENTSPAIMQGVLGSLMPHVKVSTTGSRTSPTSARPAPQTESSSPSPPPPSPDQMRQFFQQRFRDQQGGERSRGGPGGDRGGFRFGGGRGGGFGGGGRGSRD